MKSSIAVHLKGLRHLVLAFGGALLLMTPYTSAAGTVHLVRDINTIRLPQSSYPTALGTLGGKLLFGATDSTGAALWTTDGSAGGTYLLRRLPGIGIVGNSGWNNFLSAGSRAYFVSADGAGTSTVWITDGTAGGTRQVMAFPSATSATANLLGLLNGTLIFSVGDPTGNMQMYASDGTTAGTHPLTAFTGQNAGVVNGFIIAGSKFYFVAEDTMYNHQIWVSDGTSAGTHQVTNGSTSSAIYNPQAMQLVGNLVLYASLDSVWSIDTTSDTIGSVVGAPSVMNSIAFTGMGNFVLFLSGPIGGVQLWRSDGTAGGTYAVANVTANPTFNETQYPVFQKVGGRILYMADDAQNGSQLWSSDGTSANTIRLTSATAGPQDPYPIASPMSVVGGTAYFHMSDGATATTHSVWRTDGTLAATQRLGGLPSIDISVAGGTRIAGDPSKTYVGIYDASGASVSLYKYLPASNTASLAKAGLSLTAPDEFVDNGGLLLFSNNDPTLGDEPWVSDGSAAGTHLIEDINPQEADNGSLPDEFVNFGGRLAFVADDGVSGRELWISDGTAAGTTLLADINPGAASSNPNHLFTANGALYFFATDASGSSKFMRLQSVGAAVQALATLSSQPTGPALFCDGAVAVAVGTQFYFAANDGVSGLELWTSDGTSQGTHLTTNIAVGAADSYPCYLTVLAGRVYFSAVGPLGRELWSSDGSSAGTALVADIAPGTASSNPNELSLFKGALYFAADDIVHGSELWTSSGTGTGTALVADLLPGVTGSFPYPLGTLNGRLLLDTIIATQNPVGYAMHLWTSDGSSSGTTQVGSVSFPFTVNPLINGNQVFLVGQDAAGVEPWVSDGTSGGTHILKDINPSGDSNPSWFENFLGITVFEVTDPTLGEQLWRTDGTTAGTTLVSAIPSPDPSLAASARHRLTVGSNFFFSAKDPAIGTELYVLADTAPVAVADSSNSINDAAATIDVLANDTDSDGTLDAASITITTNPAHGTAVVASGKVLYTPSTGYSGVDTFAYTVKDNQGVASPPATVTVTVTAASAPAPAPSHGGGGAITMLPLFGLMLQLLLQYLRTRQRREGWLLK
jgi:ELWxxDGT repeat protein